MMENKRYHGRQLKDVYSFVLEGDTEASTFSNILQMPVERLKNYLKNLKATQPVMYGRLVFRAYIDKSSRSKLVQAITPR